MGKFNGVQFRCDYGAACRVLQRTLSSIFFGVLLACAQKKKGHRMLQERAVSPYGCLGWG